MYHVSHMFCNFTIIIFSRGLSFYRILIDTDWNRSVEEATWYLWHALTSLKCYNFIFFSIRSLLKFILIFPCHIIFLIKIVLHLLLRGISNLTLLTKSFFLFTNSISYIGFYSVTIYCTCGFPICKSFWEVCRITPWTKPNSGRNFSVCHWHLNSIPAHSFSKISLLSAYKSLHKFDIICLSEIYLDTSILPWNLSK